MTAKKFKVLIIEYKKEKDTEINKMLGELTRKLSTQQIKTRCVDAGSDERVISAVEKVLKLTE